MHYIILITTIHVTKYFVICCDEVMTIDNRSRISVHIYPREGFEHILILLNLENWLVMAHPITLPNMIMNLLLIYGGLTMKEINGKLIWFGFYGVTMFTSVRSGVTLQGTFFFEFIKYVSKIQDAIYWLLDKFYNLINFITWLRLL
jgi:hypothetical protein